MERRLCIRRRKETTAMILAAMSAVALAAMPVHTFTGDSADGVEYALAGGRDFSAAAWVKFGSFHRNNPAPRIFQFGGFYLHVYDTNRAGGVDLLAGVSGAPKTDASPKGVSVWTVVDRIPAGKWVHVAVSLSCADFPVKPRVWLNGRPARVGGIPKPTPPEFKAGSLVVGNTAIGGSRPLDGLVAAVVRKNRPFGDSEVAALAGRDPDGNVPEPCAVPEKDLLPLVDITGRTERHAVIAAGTASSYEGHPTTVVSPDGKTMFCVWTKNHGGPCGPMAKSVDWGRTWTRCDGLMPAEYRTYSNCPTLQRVPRPDGGENLAVFSNGGGGACGIVISEDGGASWRAAPRAAHLPSGMPPTGLAALKDGRAALFGQRRKDPRAKSDRETDDQDVWMSISSDGGWTWGPAVTVASAPEKNLCEPFCLRSPDGGELCLLMRENRHAGCSMMCFSRDEGRTWSRPADTPWGLTGDRHEAVYLTDGRLFVAFRDRAPGATTYGQYVAWIGSYGDMREGRPGDVRVHLLKHCGEGGFAGIDTGYSGVELAPSGEVVCTTYLKYWPDERRHSVVSTRFLPSDIVK